MTNLGVNANCVGAVGTPESTNANAGITGVWNTDALGLFNEGVGQDGSSEVRNTKKRKFEEMGSQEGEGVRSD